MRGSTDAYAKVGSKSPTSAPSLPKPMTCTGGAVEGCYFFSSVFFLLAAIGLTAVMPTLGVGDRSTESEHRIAALTADALVHSTQATQPLQQLKRRQRDSVRRFARLEAIPAAIKARDFIEQSRHGPQVLPDSHSPAYAGREDRRRSGQSERPGVLRRDVAGVRRTNGGLVSSQSPSLVLWASLRAVGPHGAPLAGRARTQLAG